MIRTTRMIALVGAAAALVMVPAVAQAGHKPQHNPGSKSKRCAKPVKVGFVVRGTLVSYTADDPTTTEANEASVTLTVTGANRHARRSGELEDADGATPGTQVTYSAATDQNGFKVGLSGYESGESPAAGDKVRVIGKIAYTKPKCAPPATSVQDRYGDVNVRKVKIIDAD
jgi:hypothetical protein